MSDEMTLALRAGNYLAVMMFGVLVSVLVAWVGLLTGQDIAMVGGTFCTAGFLSLGTTVALRFIALARGVQAQEG